MGHLQRDHILVPSSLVKNNKGSKLKSECIRHLAWSCQKGTCKWKTLDKDQIWGNQDWHFQHADTCQRKMQNLLACRGSSEDIQNTTARCFLFHSLTVFVFLVMYCILAPKHKNKDCLQTYVSFGRCCYPKILHMYFLEVHAFLKNHDLSDAGVVIYLLFKLQKCFLRCSSFLELKALF